MYWINVIPLYIGYGVILITCFTPLSLAFVELLKLIPLRNAYRYPKSQNLAQANRELQVLYKDYRIARVVSRFMFSLSCSVLCVVGYLIYKYNS